MGWSGQKRGVVRGELPGSFFGGASAAKPRSGYTEATLRGGRGRRGKVVANTEAGYVIEFYDTGEQETVSREDVSTQFRGTRA